MRTGIIISLIGSTLLMMAISLHLSLPFVMLALFLIVSTVGIVGTTSFSLAMERQGKVAGSASAFLGILPFAGGGLVSPLVGLGGEQTAVPMGLVILICSILAFIIFFQFVSRTVSKNI